MCIRDRCTLPRSHLASSKAKYREFGNLQTYIRFYKHLMAFDNVKRIKLRHIMDRTGLPDHLIDVKKNPQQLVKIQNTL